jgi:hypothetical protein
LLRSGVHVWCTGEIGALGVEPAREGTSIGPNEGEAALDALLMLGYSVEIDESGAITATLGDEVIHGQTSANAIEWRTPSALYRVRERAHIARIRQRIHEAQVAASRDLNIEGPDAQ